MKDSRPSEDGAAIRRRRQCEGCGARFTTFERVQLRDLTVVKKDGKREPFERAKLERSIAIACRKRDIEPARIDQLDLGHPAPIGNHRRRSHRGADRRGGDARAQSARPCRLHKIRQRLQGFHRTRRFRRDRRGGRGRRAERPEVTSRSSRAKSRDYVERSRDPIEDVRELLPSTSCAAPTNSYYTGHTDDLERRVAQHQSGEIKGYTQQSASGRTGVELTTSATREQAFAAERQIKGLDHGRRRKL